MSIKAVVLGLSLVLVSSAAAFAQTSPFESSVTPLPEGWPENNSPPGPSEICKGVKFPFQPTTIKGALPLLPGNASGRTLLGPAGSATGATPAEASLPRLVHVQPGANLEEDISRRGLSYKVFNRGPESLTYEFGAGPLHYRAEDGRWLEINRSLEKIDNGWINTANNFPTRLPAVLRPETPIETGQDFGFRWAPDLLTRAGDDGSEAILAGPQPSAGEPIAGRSDAIRYPNVYPGIDLIAEIGQGALRIRAVLTNNALGLKQDRNSLLHITAAIAVEPRLLTALQALIDRAPEAAKTPAILGEAEAEYVIAVLGSPDEDMLSFVTDARLDEDTARRIAKAGSHAQSLLAGQTMSHAFRFVPAVSDWRPSVSDNLPTNETEDVTQALVLDMTFTGKGRVQEQRTLNSDARRAETISVERKCRTIHNYRENRWYQVCAPEQRRIPGYPVAVAQSRRCYQESVLYVAALYAAIPFDMSPLRAATQSGLKIGNLSLGFKLGKWAPKFGKKLPLPSGADDKATFVFAQPSPKRFNPPLYNPASALTKNNRAHVVSTWATNAQTVGQYVFAPLNQLARQHLSYYLHTTSQSHFVVVLDHEGLDGSSAVGYAIAMDDLRLRVEVDTQGTVGAAVEVVTLDKSGARPDPSRSASLFPGDKLQFELTATSTQNVNSVRLEVANDAKLARDFGIDVIFVDHAGNYLPNGSTLQQNDTVQLHVIWNNPGNTSTPAGKVDVEITASFPNGGRAAETLRIPLQLFPPSADLQISPGALVVQSITGADSVDLRLTEINYASTDGKIRTTFKAGSNFDPLDFGLSPSHPSAGRDRSIDVGLTNVIYNPADLRKLAGAGFYAFRYRVCLSNARNKKDPTGATLNWKRYYMYCPGRFVAPGVAVN